MLTQTQIDGEVITMLASPLKITSQPLAVKHPPPKLGQHTHEILAEVLGYSGEQVNDLRENRVI